MIVQIDIIDLNGEVQGTLKKTGENSYHYESMTDKIFGITITQTTKGVWINFRLNYIDNFKTFLSNKNINIIEE